MLAGCGGSTGSSTLTPMSVAARINDPLTSGPEKIVYSFKGASDGANPETGVIAVNGAFYGTTSAGGVGFGTVFEVSASGKEQVLYRFKTANDGQDPYGPLLNVNGVLYGTTFNGGTTGDGTVFQVSTSGKESVVHNFKGYPSDGFEPTGNLLDVNGTLYGVTLIGGTNNFGTVFSMSSSGAERVVYSFKGSKDGRYPQAGLIEVDGTLYGTAKYSGSAGTGGGVVFGIDASGTEHVIHTFKGGKHDGLYPVAGLVADASGELYGTTESGGSARCGGASAPGCGTVFEISTSGKLKVLYSFSGGADGEYPWATLIDVNGILYGTTAGALSGSGDEGTVFSVTTSGKLQTLYAFRGYPDGAFPWFGSLTAVDGILYGTTEQGGTGKNCSSYACGTVYAVTIGSKNRRRN
jgi:uncharacterized repeat protein (TIGR03803 family)